MRHALDDTLDSLGVPEFLRPVVHVRLDRARSLAEQWIAWWRAALEREPLSDDAVRLAAAVAVATLPPELLQRCLLLPISADLRASLGALPTVVPAQASGRAMPLHHLRAPAPAREPAMEPVLAVEPRKRP